MKFNTSNHLFRAHDPASRTGTVARIVRQTCQVRMSQDRRQKNDKQKNIRTLGTCKLCSTLFIFSLSWFMYYLHCQAPPPVGHSGCFVTSVQYFIKIGEKLQIYINDKQTSKNDYMSSFL